MALAKNDIERLTLDDLLEAINPSPPSLEERLRRALAGTIKHWQNGHLTDEQAETIIRAIVATSVNRQMNEMVNDFFAPRHRRGEASPRRFLLM
jgi:hypothetical protein